MCILCACICVCVYICIHRSEVKFGCLFLAVDILFLSQGFSVALNLSWKLWWLSKHPRVSNFLALGLLSCLTVLEWNLFWGSNSYLNAYKVSILSTTPPSHPYFTEGTYQRSGDSMRRTWLSSLFSLLCCSNHNTSDWITNASGEGNAKLILLFSLSMKNKSSPHKAHDFWHKQTNKQIGNKINQFLGKKKMHFVIHTS